MFCNECGSQVPDGAKFCQQCGKTTPTGAVTSSSSGAAQAVRMGPESPSTPVSPQQSNTGRTVLLLVILVGLVAWLIYGLASSTASNRPQIASNSPTVQRQPTIQAVTVPLSEKAFTISSDQYKYFKFTIPPQSSDVRMEGRFEASGGTGNDVEVLILSEDAFTNWQNHHRVPTYYNSGKVTVGTIEARLPATITDSATYYLIFSNVFSVFSNKAVSADISLHFNRTL